MIGADMNAKKRLRITMGMIVLFLLLPAVAGAHNVSKGDAKFVQANQGAAIAPFMYLGAKHMVTGYDHLLFLVGVIFFLYKLKDVIQYVSFSRLDIVLRCSLAYSAVSMQIPISSMRSLACRSCIRPSTIWMALSASSDFN